MPQPSFLFFGFAMFGLRLGLGFGAWGNGHHETRAFLRGLCPPPHPPQWPLFSPLLHSFCHLTCGLTPLSLLTHLAFYP
uniref:Uncharacterized protein n=1 Tax=Physcomitrium patens TaxID=3218 RepID=A0A2K1K6R9_PHYPA|nr:hypothetical protein PHYPA_011370 [Physcomitrium patens]